MYLFNGDPILRGNLTAVDAGYVDEYEYCHLLSENKSELNFSPTNKGTVSSFQSNAQLGHLNESIEFVVWSLDDIFISINYELKNNVDKFYPLILHFDDNFDNLLSNTGFSSERTIVSDPVEGIALLDSNNDDTFVFIGNREPSDAIFDMRKEEGGHYALYIVMHDPPKKGNFIVSIKNLMTGGDVKEQFNKYSNSFKNPPTYTIGPEECHPALIEGSKKSVDTEINTKVIKSPMFIRENGKKCFEINFSSNKPVYVEGSIKTRLGQKIIDKKDLKQYFTKDYTYKVPIVPQNTDAMPWDKESKLTTNLIYFYGPSGEGLITSQTTLISDSFIKLVYMIYLIIVTLSFSLIYGNNLKNMDQYPFLLSIIIPTIFLIISVFMNDSALYYSGKINIHKPSKLLLEIPVSIGFLILISISAYQCCNSLTSIGNISIIDLILLISSIPIFFVNKIWIIVPVLLITIEFISNIHLIIPLIQKLIK